MAADLTKLAGAVCVCAWAVTTSFIVVQPWHGWRLEAAAHLVTLPMLIMGLFCLFDRDG